MMPGLLLAAILAATPPGADSGADVPMPPTAPVVPVVTFTVSRVSEDDAPDGEPRYVLATDRGRFVGCDFGGELVTLIDGPRVVVVTGDEKRWSADVLEIRDGRPVVVHQVEDVSARMNPSKLLGEGRPLAGRWGVVRE